MNGGGDPGSYEDWSLERSAKAAQPTQDLSPHDDPLDEVPPLRVEIPDAVLQLSPLDAEQELQRLMRTRTASLGAQDWTRARIDQLHARLQMANDEAEQRRTALAPHEFPPEIRQPLKTTAYAKGFDPAAVQHFLNMIVEAKQMGFTPTGDEYIRGAGPNHKERSLAADAIIRQAGFEHLIDSPKVKLS